MTKKFLLIFLLIFTSTFASNINVAVAANVSYAINDLIKEFNTIYPDIKVRVTLGSSGKLTAQINHAAPYDIFMSANMKYPEFLYKNNLAITKPTIYTKGALAILSTKKKDFTNGINIITNKNIKVIAVANPKTAPYGIATEEALKNANLYKLTKHKFIYAESISQTVSYTMNASDLGFVAKSSLYSSHMKQYKEGINWIDVDTSLYTAINQGIVILKKAKNNNNVKKFYDFILSKNAQSILQRFGYLEL